MLLKLSSIFAFTSLAAVRLVRLSTNQPHAAALDRSEWKSKKSYCSIHMSSPVPTTQDYTFPCHRSAMIDAHTVETVPQANAHSSVHPSQLIGQPANPPDTWAFTSPMWGFDRGDIKTTGKHARTGSGMSYNRFTFLAGWCNSTPCPENLDQFKCLPLEAWTDCTDRVAKSDLPAERWGCGKCGYQCRASVCFGMS